MTTCELNNVGEHLPLWHVSVAAVYYVLHVFYHFGILTFDLPLFREMCWVIWFLHVFWHSSHKFFCFSVCAA